MRTAHLIPLVVLPSGLWRVGIALGFSMGMVEGGRPVHITGWESVYVLSLSVVSEALALLSFGLVRSWGEVVPAWIPFIGGRRVPPLAAVLPAVAGSVALTAIFADAAVDMLFRGGAEFAAGWGAVTLLPGPLSAAGLIDRTLPTRSRVPKRPTTDRNASLLPLSRAAT